MKVFCIECMTGCTCCSNENHYRGFYKTREDAERRVNYWKNGEGSDFPLASQYARRGRYDIEEWDAEEISDNRIIVNKRVFKNKFIEVNEDGSINQELYDEEQLCF